MEKIHKTIINIVIITMGVVALFFLLNKKEEIDLLKIKVAGVVLDLSNTPVAGIDLVVGDTSIRTGESGRFVFANVNVETGIRLTHPELLRAIVKLPETLKDAQTTNILFDVSLYNSLITIIDAEARGGAERVYDYLAQEIKRTHSFETFNNAYELLFTEENITDQEIIIKRIRHEANYYLRGFDLRFEEMVEFEVIKGYNTKWYRLILSDNEEGSEWWLIP